MALLRSYHIFIEVTLKSGRAYALTPDFAKSLRRALTGAGKSHSFGDVAQIPAQKKIATPDLDQYARQQWEGILGYMVGSSAVPIEDETPLAEPSLGVIEILRAGHLIELAGTNRTGRDIRITKEGFAFVLQDINTQLWALLFEYVNQSDVFNRDKVDVLSFIFFVSSLELGLAYSTRNFDIHQLNILKDLSGFGIVYLPVDSNGDPGDHFWPSRLATSLTSDSTATLSATNTTLSSSLSSGTSQGFVIIETNYRVYAYTSSPLQIALLSLFMNLRSRHPNLVTGKMSKSSIQRAIRRGITADQIIAYLTSHAHPQMHRHAQAEQAREATTGRVVPILPATIVDQIHLWQLEDEKIQTSTGFLLKDFASQLEYEEPCRYADETGVLVWKKDKARMFFVSRIEGVKSFMAERKQNQAGG